MMAYNDDSSIFMPDVIIAIIILWQYRQYVV